MLHFFINLDKWNSLPAAYKAVLANAAHHANTDMQAKYDPQPGRAEARRRRRRAAAPLPAGGHAGLLQGRQEVYAETAATNPTFKKVHDNHMAFRGDQYLWWQVAEFNMDNFMVRAKAAGSSELPRFQRSGMEDPAATPGFSFGRS